MRASLPEEEPEEVTLRPRHMDEFIGQERVVDKLKVALLRVDQEEPVEVLKVRRPEHGPLPDDPRGLVTLAELRQPVDTFFDDVMVMTEDEQLRDNRLALLNALHGLFLRVADISRLQG